MVDATGQTLGRLASSIARILRGKHKPTYTQHQNMGDCVVVVNSAKMVVTGGKLDDKVYTRYTGYPSGLRTRSLRRQPKLDATVPLVHAVEGMLQRNTLGGEQLRGCTSTPERSTRTRRSGPSPSPSTRRGTSELPEQEILARAVGRRKEAIARVRLVTGEGRITINNKEALAYLGQRRLEQVVLRPLRLTETQRRFDVSIKVEGGGVSGQAGAISPPSPAP